MEIIKLNGSVELAPIVGLSEVIVDIVETGTTLKENGLCVLEEVCDLSARIVVNQVSMKMENKRISEIIDKNDKNNFIYDFLGVYDIPKATVTKLRKGINNLADDPNEVYLKNKLYYKQTDGNPMQAFSDVKNKVDALI